MKKILIFMFCVCTILAESCPEITSGSDVSGKVIKNCSYKGKNLSGFNFTGAEMEDVDFSNANLEKAKFNDLKNAKNINFYNANLSNAKFKGSSLTFSDFTFANLKGVDMSPLKVGGSLRESYVEQMNVFYGVKTDLETNVDKAHLPLGFFAAVNGKYSGVPYFYFG